jgi:hypothetical protein
MILAKRSAGQHIRAPPDDAAEMTLDLRGVFRVSETGIPFASSHC